MRKLVILAVLGYRLIPQGIRSSWTVPGGGSSGKALNALRNGKPVIETLRRFAMPRGSWADLYWFIPED